MRSPHQGDRILGDGKPVSPPSGWKVVTCGAAAVIAVSLGVRRGDNPIEVGVGVVLGLLIAASLLVQAVLGSRQSRSSIGFAAAAVSWLGAGVSYVLLFFATR